MPAIWGNTQNRAGDDNFTSFIQVIINLYIPPQMITSLAHIAGNKSLHKNLAKLEPFFCRKKFGTLVKTSLA